MVALNEVNEFRRRGSAEGEATEQPEKSGSHALRTGGIILLILGALGLYYMWPEIRREIKMLRM